MACAWSNSSMCKNLRGQHPLWAEIVFLKSRFRWVQTHMSYFLDSGPKFTRLVSPNARGIDLDYMSFQFWISCLVSEIFTIKVGSWVKSCQILHLFGPQIFLGKCPLNFRTCIIKFSQISIMWQSFTVIGRLRSVIRWQNKKKINKKNICC